MASDGKNRQSALDVVAPKQPDASDVATKAARRIRRTKAARRTTHDARNTTHTTLDTMDNQNIEDTDTFTSILLQSTICHIKLIDKSVQQEQDSYDELGFYLCKLIQSKAKNKTTMNAWVPEEYIKSFLPNLHHDFELQPKIGCYVKIGKTYYTRSRQDGTNLPTRVPKFDRKSKWIEHFKTRLNKACILDTKQRTIQVYGSC